MAFLRVLLLCEARGQWPQRLTLIVIVLLPHMDEAAQTHSKQVGT